MDILFCVDRNFVPLAKNCVHSILKNGGCKRYDAYVLHSDLTETDMADLRSAGGDRMHFTFLTVPEDLFEGFPESDRYPRQIYYRLIAPMLLPRDMERILYLDVDTVVINPLAELEAMPFDGAWFMACTHVRKSLTRLNQIRLGMDLEKNAPYLNSGVLLFNLPLFREKLGMEQIRDYANQRKGALLLPDQDILTALCGDHVKLLDPLRYNLSDRILAFHNANPQREQVDLDWVRRNSVIIHYCGKNKPWREGYKGILDVFYQENRVECGPYQADET